MKTIRLILCSLTAILLVGWPVLASAQEIINTTKKKRSPAEFRVLKNSMKQQLLSSWTGNGTNRFVYNIAVIESYPEKFGLSKEQGEKIRRFGFDMHNDPEYQSLIEEWGQLSAENPGDPFGENVPQETQMKFLELRQKIDDILQKKRDDVINETLTPKQRKVLQEYQIATMPGGSFPGNLFLSPDMFEALGLSDKQKGQLEAIKKELRPEFEKNVDKFVEKQMTLRQKNEALGEVTNPAEKEKIRAEVNKLHQEISDMITSANQLVVDKMKFKMFDVLTDEQMERLGKLIDDPPDHIKKIFERLNQGTAPLNTSEWRPGPDSWKPGDGVPADYLKYIEERKARFPRRK